MGELTRAAQWVGGTQAVVASLAAVTAGTLHVGFALTGAGDVITAAAVLRPLWTAHTACGASAGSQRDFPEPQRVRVEPIIITNTDVCRRRGGPSGCGGWAGSPGHTGHTLVPPCGADSRRTRLRFSSRWPRTRLGQSGSAGHDCCTRILWRAHREVNTLNAHIHTHTLG